MSGGSCSLISTGSTGGTTSSGSTESTTVVVRQEPGFKLNDTAVRVIVWMTVGTGLMAAIVAFGSIQGLFSFIHLLQMYFLLPMLPKYFPEYLKSLIVSLYFPALSFNFIPAKVFSEGNTFKSWGDEPQSDAYLERIGMESESAIIGHFSYFSNIVFLMLVHLIIFVSYRCSGKKVSDASNLNSTLGWLLKYFTFGVYIRLTILSLLYNSILLVRELNKYETKTNSKSVSFLI